MTLYYSDDSVELHLGDCRDVTEWLAADVLVTDPPYGMAYRSGYTNATIIADHDTTIRDAALGLWAPRPVLAFGRWSVPKPADTRITLTWDKGDWPGMGDLRMPWGLSTEEIYVLGEGFAGRRTGSIVRDPRRPSGTTALHPSEKPICLMSLLIAKCPPGVVADPFAGSGSTLVAAKALGRKAIGVEVDERYCEIAARRLSQGVLDFGEPA